MKKNDIIKEIIEISSEITGGIISALSGSLIAGPMGFVIGGFSGPTITKLFQKIGEEVQNKILSPRENIKIGTVYTFALNRIIENEKLGKKIRLDNFFGLSTNLRSISEEIFEGIIISAQREHQEFKLKYLGNLFANICYDESYKSDEINHLIKLTNVFTYRQLCCLALYYKRHIAISSELQEKNKVFQPNVITWDLSNELEQLKETGMINNVSGGMVHMSRQKQIFPYNVCQITHYGLSFVHLLELQTIENSELQKFNELLRINI